MTAVGTPQNDRPDQNLGLSLTVIATAQLMLVLDDSIANIALPVIQNELGISAANLPWVINAYILAFGGLLLFGGRLGDLFGRRRLLQIGMAVFTLASLLAGLAQDGASLIAFRGLQGLGAALTAPNALALIATTFPEGQPRSKAMAVYGGMSALGIVAGLLLGGVLTSTLGWRWVFFINIPIGLAVLAGSRILAEADLHRGRLDLAGAATSIAGMSALVYAITRGGEHGWTDEITLAAFAVAAVMLPLFLILQSRGKSPLLPLHLFNDRNRTGSYLATALLAFGPMGAFYLLTLYMQHIESYSPIAAGLAWLPFAIGLVLGAGISSKLVLRLAPRQVAVPGMLIAGGALFWLSRIGDAFDYAGHFMPGAFLLGFGFAMGIVSLTLTAVKGVAAQETGIASALLNASQQIGVAFGLAVLSTVSVTATASRMPDALAGLYRGRNAGDQGLVEAANDALVHGYGLGLAAASAALIAAAVIAAVLVNARRGEVSAELV
ncbi:MULTISPECIES: MFS transporter [Paracoccus]|uniref:EmrB/QacA subfamily drug resistance transporter n=1 Tax=Paracoccus versutus TaxID=34007 RepID=A0A3D9XSU0_PARVE|nr:MULTISPECIES: MFS transporter [Paracoccus]MDF3907562.1 MFS transporter [Paracoccus sp. AS002]REF73416.1 EmrB/QacA subfamily drug resistance transporter [Paracoccus versutus]WGR54565.1 DHA2 family efflux MFS transporter permease subunit [Paracoccus versutus]